MKNAINLNESKIEIVSTIDNVKLSPQIYDFLRFIVDRAGKSAVAIVNTCAMDDSPYWEAMFEVGMADAMSEDPQLEAQFLGRMCDKPGLPHAYKLMDAYFQQMPQERKEKLFSIPGLKKRGHHFSVCFYNASFSNSCGAHLLKVLNVLIKHGLPLQPIIDRNYAEIERAALLGHVEFLRTITQSGVKLPDELFQVVMQKSSVEEMMKREENTDGKSGVTEAPGRDIELLSMLIDECGVNLDQILGEKVIGFANQKTRSYLNARRVRAKRIPETQIDPELEESFECD